MIALHAQHKYYLYGQPTDMRKSFDGLSGLVRNHLRRNPTSGEVYVFLNRKRDMIKVLLWDRSGFAIYSKRLERGSFERPRREDSAAGVQLSWEELVLILEGISWAASSGASVLRCRAKIQPWAAQMWKTHRLESKNRKVIPTAWKIQGLVCIKKGCLCWVYAHFYSDFWIMKTRSTSRSANRNTLP
ncbi:MAG: IS66 family insertion sequence element accessory protein TnpB [Haliscomenobacter sp.]|nr:IS66 family insertion sequence element accessory protein TnpB [Haliscomenobacter sp.]